MRVLSVVFITYLTFIASSTSAIAADCSDLWIVRPSSSTHNGSFYLQSEATADSAGRKSHARKGYIPRGTLVRVTGSGPDYLKRIIPSDNPAVPGITDDTVRFFDAAGRYGLIFRSQLQRLEQVATLSNDTCASLTGLVTPLFLDRPLQVYDTTLGDVGNLVLYTIWQETTANDEGAIIPHYTGPEVFPVLLTKPLQDFEDGLKNNHPYIEVTTFSPDDRSAEIAGKILAQDYFLDTAEFVPPDRTESRDRSYRITFLPVNDPSIPEAKPSPQACNGNSCDHHTATTRFTIGLDKIKRLRDRNIDFDLVMAEAIALIRQYADKLNPSSCSVIVDFDMDLGAELNKAWQILSPIEFTAAVGVNVRPVTNKPSIRIQNYFDLPTQHNRSINNLHVTGIYGCDGNRQGAIEALKLTLDSLDGFIELKKDLVEDTVDAELCKVPRFPDKKCYSGAIVGRGVNGDVDTSSNRNRFSMSLVPYQASEDASFFIALENHRSKIATMISDSYPQISPQLRAKLTTLIVDLTIDFQRKGENPA